VRLGSALRRRCQPRVGMILRRLVGCASGRLSGRFCGRRWPCLRPVLLLGLGPRFGRSGAQASAWFPLNRRLHRLCGRLRVLSSGWGLRLVFSWDQHRRHRCCSVLPVVEVPAAAGRSATLPELVWIPVLLVCIRRCSLWSCLSGCCGSAAADCSARLQVADLIPLLLLVPGGAGSGPAVRAAAGSAAADCSARLHG
jgi:hypothetical protein